MDYKKHYIQLIQSRINRTPINGEYYETHHIVPKCWGGSNKKENLISLTAREHYIAHWLLYRIRPDSNGVSFAFWKMTFPGGRNVEREYKISSRAYAEAKTAMSIANKKLNTGKKVKPEHLIKWSKNKNNSKQIIHTQTGETYTNAKQLWRDRFSTTITYSAFNYYLRGKIKGKLVNRKCNNSDIYLWKYLEM
jgi:hypothetical protein